MATKTTAVRVSAFLILIAAVTAQGQSSFCTKGHEPDVVRVRLSSECGKQNVPIEVRRDGDDSNREQGTWNSAGWWELPAFDETIGSVMFCSNVCGFASMCVSGKPKPERDASGNNVCVAEYTFRCDVDSWTLGIQAKPEATLLYTRTRDEQKQRGQLKAFAIKPVEMCDLAPNETVTLIPQTKKSYTFNPIPITYETLEVKKGKVWTLGPNLLQKYVVLPAARRTQGSTANELAFVELDIKELKVMIRGGEQ